MKIITQKTQNECGISCINMLINHYYHSNNDFRCELLDQVHLSSNGISLLDLENLASKYNIEINSYQMTFEELNKVKNEHNPSIFIVKNNEVIHYVIGFIRNNKIIIYDPIGDKKIITKNEFLNIWTGIICFTKKINSKNIQIHLNNKKIFKIDYKINFLFLFFELFGFVFSLFLNIFMSKLINLSTQNIINGNIIKIFIIFLLTILFDSFFDYLLNQIKIIYFKKYQRKLTINFFNFLLLKQKEFYECYTSNTIIRFLNLANEILEFYLLYFSNLMNKLIIVIFNSILLIIILPNFWIIISIYWIIVSVFSFCSFKITHKYQSIFLDKINLIDDNLLKFVTNTKSIHHYEWKKSEIEQAILDTLNIQNENYINHSNKNIIFIIFKFINYLFNFLILIYLWNRVDLSIGMIFFVFNLFNFFSNSSNQLSEIIKNIFLIKPIQQCLHAFISTNNVKDENNKIKWNKIDILSYKNIDIKNNVLIFTDNLNNHEIINVLLKQEDSLNNIKLNNIYLSNLNKIDIYKNTIFFDSNYQLNEQQIYKILNSNLYINYLEKLNLNFTSDIKNKNINYEAKVIFTLLLLLEEKNKIICFNNFFKFNINENILNDVFALMKRINNNNFIIGNFDNEKIAEFYEYEI